MTSFIFIKILKAFFVVSGFFFVPILTLVGFFCPGSLKKGPQRIVFGVISLSLMASYFVLGNGSTRYILIPLFLVGCFAGAGLELIANLFSSFSKRKDLVKSIVMSILTFIAVITCAWRCWTHNRTECMDVFSNLIVREHADSTVVFGINSHTAQKLGGLLNEFNDIVFYDIGSWKDAIQIFVPMQADNTNFYFVVEIPKEYDISHFRNWFQSCYYIFPFQVICENYKGSKRFILLKFNHKTMDGRENNFSTDILEQLPSPLTLQNWRGNISFRDIKEYLPAETFQGNKFFEFEKGTGIGTSLYTRLNLYQPNSPASITLRNDVFWPESICNRVLLEETNLQEQMNNYPQNSFHSDLLAQIAAPALLDLLPASRVILPESDHVLHFSGAIPGFFIDSDRFRINGKEQEFIDTTQNQDNRIDILIEDQYIHSSTQKKLELTFLSHNSETESPASVLVLDDSSNSKRLKLKECLENTLPAQSEVDQIVVPMLEEWGQSLRSISNLPKKEYDVIVVNLFIDPMNRPWSLQFETDHVFERDYSFLIKELQDTYAGSKILIVLPPAPPPEPAMYTTCDSSRLARLSHYRVCSAALRWYNNHNDNKISLVPLYLFADPGTDYTRHTTINNKPVRTGYYFTPEALTKFARVVSCFIQDITSYSGNTTYSKQTSSLE